MEQDSICSDRLKGAEDNFERVNTEGTVIALAELNYREWGPINPSAGHIDCSGNAHLYSKAKSKMFQMDVTYQATQKAGKGILAKGSGEFVSHPALRGLEKALRALGK